MHGWHVGTPTHPDDLVWQDLRPGGYTDLGAALDLSATALTVPPMEERALPPAVVLVSDGMPTDDFESAMERLLALPWGARAVRMAVAIGQDADYDTLATFIADPTLEPVTASNPEQLLMALRWATVHVARAASSLAPDRAAARPGDCLVSRRTARRRCGDRRTGHRGHVVESRERLPAGFVARDRRAQPGRRAVRAAGTSPTMPTCGWPRSPTVTAARATSAPTWARAPPWTWPSAACERRWRRPLTRTCRRCCGTRSRTSSTPGETPCGRMPPPTPSPTTEHARAGADPDGGSGLTAYGATLLVALVGDHGVAIAQVGDGDALVRSHGFATRPVPG